MITGIESMTDNLELNASNCRFSLSEHGLLLAEIDPISYRDRAFLALAFPFQKEEEYISVLNAENEEMGMIRSLDGFDEKTADLIRAELRKKYFAPKIKKILKTRERNGVTYWDCDTDHGVLAFTVRDVHRSMIRAGEDRLFLVDIDGCRYEIESVSSLDKKSHSKIELYL